MVLYAGPNEKYVQILTLYEVDYSQYYYFNGVRFCAINELTDIIGIIKCSLRGDKVKK